MIADAIRQAQKLHREIMEQTYEGICSIYGMQPVKDPMTKVTRQEELLVLTDLPCRLSFSGSPASSESGTATSVVQTIKLFLAPETRIPPGSRIEVTQQGRTESYAQSGKAAVYSSHQEIVLELWKEYA